ncbi:hypothetical protein IE53DRAFT_278454 [Violaceomyces palustris]|uniref:Uncharacterized protein n=1 Tax=Violaceomyces palustris TaxID=1673888 RepID=A0ACD0NMF7_9BASI|nr:hypothetical protein IE53DRAFT_278454 [Violaceomyces palustris]
MSVATKRKADSSPQDDEPASKKGPAASNGVGNGFSGLDGDDSDDSLTDLSDEEGEQPGASSDDEEEEEEEEEDEEEESSEGEADDGDSDFGGGPKKKKKTSSQGKRKALPSKAGSKSSLTSRAGKSSNGTAPKTPKSRGTGAKRSRTAGGSTLKRVKGGPTKARGATSKEDLPIKDDNAIFNAVKDPNSALQSTAEDWVVSYQEKPGPALAELINFVIRACGCNGSVDENEVQDIDNIVDALEDLQEVFKKETMPSYPLISKSKSFKAFRKSLSEFIGRLIHNASEAETLSAEGFMETFQAWISAMSSSSLRSFRHTATVVALWTISAINEVGAAARKDLTMATKQRDAEKKKAKNDKSRLKELESKVEEAKELRAKLDEYVDEFINTVFVHRYRDFDAGIRTECVDELGVWMKRYPAQFLQGSYFRYLGWVLSDKDAGVRVAAVRAMSGLYTKDEFAAPIRHFTEMFKARLVQMAIGDIDLGVRISTIAVLSRIDRQDLLEEEQRDSLATHIFDVEPRVRVAVASFVAGMLDELVEEASEDLASPSGGKKGPADHEAEVSKLRFKCLASLLVKYGKRLDRLDSNAGNAAGDDVVDSQDPAAVQAAQRRTEDLASSVDGAREGRIGMAVEALWDAVESIQSWQPLIDLLLLDHSDGGAESERSAASTSHRGKGKASDSSSSGGMLAPRAYRLDAEEEAVLVEALVAIMRKTHHQADLTKDDEDTSKEDITRAMMPALPKLLAKYRTDAPRISDLLLVPQLMELEMYTEMGETAAFEALWDDISAQMQRHVEPTLLKHAVDAVRKLTSTTSLSTSNATKLSALEDSLVTALREKAQGRDVETAGFTEDEVHSLGASVYRIMVLSQACDTSEAMEEDEGGQATSGWEIVLGLASRGRLGYREESKMVEDTIKVLTLHVMWKTRSSLSTTNAAAVEELVSKRATFLDLLNEYVAAGTMGNACHGVQRVVFEKLLTIYMMFAALPGGGSAVEGDSGEEATVGGSNSRLPASLRLPCDSQVQERCEEFVKAEIERYIESSGLREGLLGGDDDQDNTSSGEERRGGEVDGENKGDEGEDDDEEEDEDEEAEEEEEEDEEMDEEDEDPERTPRAKSSKKAGKSGGKRSSLKRSKKLNNGSSSSNKKRKRRRGREARVERRPSQAELEAEHIFCSTISTFVSAIRVGVVDSRHSACVLCQYGRLGNIFDSCCKVLVEVLREEAIFGGAETSGKVEETLWKSLSDSFETYLDLGDSASEARMLSLSRQVGNALLVRGAGFVALKKVSSRFLVSLHLRATDTVVRRFQASGDVDKRSSKRVPTLYKAMANLLMTATPSDAIKIKAGMDRSFREAKMEIPAFAKAWEPMRSYERRLVKVASKDETFASIARGKPTIKKPTTTTTAAQRRDERQGSVDTIDSGGELSEEEEGGSSPLFDQDGF